MTNRFFGFRTALIVLFLASAPTLAMAYIDPGNGAYMVQALFTLVGAALFYIRHPIRTAKLVWNRLLRRESPQSEPHADSDGSDPTGEKNGEFKSVVTPDLGEPSPVGGSADPKG